MDGIHFSSMIQKVNPRKSFLNSSAFRIPLFICFSLIYFFLLSPFLEKSITNSILNGVRENKIVTLNYLTPLYGQEIYTNDYTINTLISSDIIKISRDKTNIQTEDPRVIAMQKFLFIYE